MRDRSRTQVMLLASPQALFRDVPPPISQALTMTEQTARLGIARLGQGGRQTRCGASLVVEPLRAGTVVCRGSGRK